MLLKGGRFWGIGRRNGLEFIAERWCSSGYKGVRLAKNEKELIERKASDSLSNIISSKDFIGLSRRKKALISPKKPEFSMFFEGISVPIDREKGFS